jgi:hypothetical protein
MESIYFDPTKAGSFGGVRSLARASNVRENEVRKWLSAQDAYTLHKPAQLRFRRRTTFSVGIDDLWQADLVDLTSLSNHNDGHRFILTIIDVFSKYAWALALRNKTGITIRDAFASVIGARKPNFLQTDKGTEFLNHNFQLLLTESGIKFYTSQNEDIKCAVVERFNRTLKSRMFRYFTFASTLRYIDVLDGLTSAYNESFHRSIKAAPASVTLQNEGTIRSHLYKPKRLPLIWKFKSGETVRLRQARRPFKKGYLPSWTDEIFTVTRCIPTDPPTYAVCDYGGENIEGKFYAEELQKVIKKDDDVYKIEKVLMRRKKGGNIQYFVKWLGYPNKFNSWVDNISAL